MDKKEEENDKMKADHKIIKKLDHEVKDIAKKADQKAKTEITAKLTNGIQKAESNAIKIVDESHVGANEASGAINALKVVEAAKVATG